MSKIFFEPLALAFKAVRVDNITEAELKNSLKKIIIRGSKDRKAQYDSGILTIQDRMTNIAYMSDRVKKLQKSLEQAIGIRPYKSIQAIMMESLSRLPGQELNRITSKLARLYTKWLDDKTVQVPASILHLNTGNSIKGYIVKGYNAKTRDNIVIVDKIKSTPTMLTYVPLSEIQTISIDLTGDQHYVSEAIYHLSFGELKIPPAKTPGRLAVHQQANGLAQKLTRQLETNINLSVPWAEVATTDTASAELSYLLKTIGEVITELSTDKEIKTALQKNLESIKIFLGKNKKVIFNNKVLEVHVASNDMDIPWSKKKILELINEGL